MPLWTKDVKLSFLERQVLSSRNVAPHPFWDFFFGGLNYQVEHHLFPNMPRVHLNRARDLVIPLCKECGLPREEMGAFASTTRSSWKWRASAVSAPNRPEERLT
jgi:fatty acid desaturase